MQEQRKSLTAGEIKDLLLETRSYEEAYIGYITEVVVRNTGVKISFVKENKLLFENLNKLEFELNIGRWELNRTYEYQDYHNLGVL